MTYIANERYLFCDNTGTVSIGDVIDVSNNTLHATNMSDANYHRGTSMYSIPLDFIESSFKLSDLKHGTIYRFWKYDGFMFESKFDRITNNTHRETLHTITSVFHFSVPLYHIKKIECI